MTIAKSEIAAGAYMPTLASATSLSFDDDMMHVSFTDGRIVSVPIVWFPRLRNASRSQLENYEIRASAIEIHWPDMDEDLSVAGFLAGVNFAAV